MELLQLKYFYALAQSQHVTQTAEELHIAQPALTQTIHRLESELGVKLFRRSGRNIVLTEYGDYLQKKIAPVIKTLNEIPEDLRRLSASARHLVRLNVLAASTLITETIIEFKKTHEDASFILMQNEKETNVDLTVFTRESFQPPKGQEDRYAVFTEPIYLAVPVDSAYAKRKSIALSEIADRPFIEPSITSSAKEMRGICDRFCMRAGFTPNIVFESDSFYAAKNLISASQGLGFWPEHSWGEIDRHNMALIPISEPVCRRAIVLHLQDTDRDFPLAKEYFAFLIRYFKTIFTGQPKEPSGAADQ